MGYDNLRITLRELQDNLGNFNYIPTIPGQPNDRHLA